MSSISNRFYVTALEDGTTLHGNLVSDKSLTQSWNDESAVPDWTIASEQPTIYLTLLSGGTLVEPSTEFTWYYNDEAISFNASGISANGLFQRTTKSVTMGTVTATMPALKIIGNLASSDNVDMDRIAFVGNYTINGTGISFRAEAQVRITRMESNGYLGVINFKDGVSDITEKGQSILMYGTLYGSDGSPVTGATTMWYLNGASTGTPGATISGYSQAYQITESQVVDHAVIACRFYVGNDLKYTSYCAVDDMQDPEYMYVQYNGANGNAASLRRGEVARFDIFVGTRTDPTPIGGVSTPTYQTYKVLLLDGDGEIIMDSSLTQQIPNPDTNGYRTLPMEDGKAYITPDYATVNSHGKNLTGIIIASTSAS